MRQRRIFILLILQVKVISTCHTAEMMNVVSRRGAEVRKPAVIVDYNNGMKGVDVSDQLASSYPTPRKTVKWYQKLFFNFLDMTVVNAYAVHKVRPLRLCNSHV